MLKKLLKIHLLKKQKNVFMQLFISCDINKKSAKSSRVINCIESSWLLDLLKDKLSLLFEELYCKYCIYFEPHTAITSIKIEYFHLDIIFIQSGGELHFIFCIHFLYYIIVYSYTLQISAIFNYDSEFDQLFIYALNFLGDFWLHPNNV